MPSTQARIAVIGAGPAGLMAADAAAQAGARVTICDAMPSAGRKFLMAGRSGLNITHSEPFERFVHRYGAAADWLRPMLERFSPDDMRAFCAELGVETFVGSSGRVFPREMKASPLLRAWLRRLETRGVVLRTRARLVDIGADGGVAIETPDGVERLRADAIVLALGGASWPRLGSTGEWRELLERRGVAFSPFRPANCGVEIDWPDEFRARFEGQAIKTAAFSYGGRTVRGEAVVTRRGLEGGPVYALAADIGASLARGEATTLTIDLKPDLSAEALARRFAGRRKGDSLSNALRKTLGLSPLAVALVRAPAPRERGRAAIAQGGAGDATGLLPLPRSGEGVGRGPTESAILPAVKSLPLPVRAVAGLDRAISSAGGVRLDEIDAGLMLKRLPGVFLAGEMLDWDAPTGGYLLQACFATGKAAGEAAARFALTR